MRRSILTPVVVAAAFATLAAATAGTAAGARPASANEVLSIENAAGTIKITGRGYLNMRVTQGSVLVVDQTPADRFSPYLGGVPRGRSSGATGRDINLYVLGGRYKVTVRGSGISISARGDGVAVVQGVPDATGDAGTIRVGEVVWPIAQGDARVGFGAMAGRDRGQGESGDGKGQGAGGGRS